MTHIEIDGKIILSGCLILNNKNEILLLYRKDNKHYETPGGKVELNECENKVPTKKDLEKTAIREVFEELGSGVVLEELEYFGNVDFQIKDGRKAIAHKFKTKILFGKPKINEPETFSKLEWLQLDKLELYEISPDLKLLLSKLKGEKNE